MIIIALLLLAVSFVSYFYKSQLISKENPLMINIIYVICPFISCFFCYFLYVKNLSFLLIITIIVTLTLIIKCIDKKFTLLQIIMFVSLVISFIMSICIVLCLIYESKLFFSKVPILDFLFGMKWNPDTTEIDGKIVGAFGILPLLTGTLLIVIIAMIFSVPLGLFSAIYISEYANKKVRYVVNATLEILSGIPTVVYGYFAVIFLSPVIRSLAKFCHFHAQSENALVAGLVIGIMILPFITSLMENSIRSVPKILRYGSMALGATCAETTWNIVIPYALPSIISAVLLSVSRVIGETMIVLMAAGISANLTFNPFHSVTTVTVQIATLLTGDQNFHSVQTSSAYALGLTLFVITWLLNSCALYIVRRNSKPI